MFNISLSRLCALGLMLFPLFVSGAEANLLEIGRRIYLDGVLPEGGRVHGQRGEGTPLTGKDAACVACHRASGLGSVEGNEIIPPITGRAIFGTGEPVVVRQDRRFEPGFSVPHAPYDDAGFANAVRLGKHLTGRDMNPLMPRYALSDVEVAALSAYLRTLSTQPSPGVTHEQVHLATVIAPGVTPERRKAFLDTLNAMLNQHNVNVHSGQRQKIPPIERRLKTRRKWTLEVRELSGPSDTWAAQLDRWQQQQPAFAVLSGLGLDNWQPVQDFCERSRVACWFPSVDLVPANAASSAYSLYFSEGMALEAKVVAQRLNAASKPPRKVLQVVADDVRARGAADVLKQALGNQVAVQSLTWDAGQPEQLASAIKGLGKQDAVVFWSGCEAIQAAAEHAAPSSAFVSAALCNLEDTGLPETWKGKVQLVQRLELPAMRAANLTRFKGWARYRNLDIVDEKMQSEAYYAAHSMATMLTSMLNNLHTDYLIERAESTLSMRESMQVQEEIQSMMMGGGGRRPSSAKSPAPDTMADEAVMPSMPAPGKVDIQEMMKRRGVTAYPRMTLGPGQRFASHGAYLVPMCTDAKACEAPEWVVPEDIRHQNAM